MTRGKLIEFGLQSSEAVGLAPAVSRLMLNLAQDRIASDYNFKYMRQTYPNTAKNETLSFDNGVRVYNLPSNYGRISTLKLWNGMNYRPIMLLTDQEWEHESRTFESNPMGMPDKFRITTSVDEDSFSDNVIYQLEINRNPDKSYPVVISYYYMPKWRDVNDDATDGYKTLFPDHLVLEMLKYYLKDYMSAPDAPAQWQKADLLIKNYLVTQTHLEPRQDSFALSPQVYSQKEYRP